MSYYYDHKEESVERRIDYDLSAANYALDLYEQSLLKALEEV